MAIQFDGPNKVIILTSGTVTLSVRDLWSRWVDWLLTSDNSKYLPAMSLLGGDEIDPIAGTKIPVYVSLLNGWRIRPQAASHILNVTAGILLVLGGGDPFVEVPSFTVRINYKQPVEAIGFSTGGGGGATPEQIAAAILALAQLTPIHADIRKVNAITVDGTGADADPFGPV